jgi:photosystem II stability/assembly factor-like uncharacterized protein
MTRSKRAAGQSRGRLWRGSFLAAVVVIIAAGTAYVALRGSSQAAQPWARLGTQDVHSLSFIGGDSDRLLFGHHGGLLTSSDGGRTWSSMPVREDAMSLAPATDGSIVIAGHEVFSRSDDGGATWSKVQTDLPSLDIHGFARDPGDPARMWAYPVTGGLWESIDGGAHFDQVRPDNVLFPLATTTGGSTRLLGVDTSGFVASEDGGRSWSGISAPDFGPITSVTATPDGSVIYAGTPDGLHRSEDGGRTWEPTGYTGSAFALATTPDGRDVAVVSRATEFFRSSDSGATFTGP